MLNFSVSMGKGSRIQKEKTNDLEKELMKVKIMKEIWALCLRQIAFLWLFYRVLQIAIEFLKVVHYLSSHDMQVLIQLKRCLLEFFFGSLYLASL